jgi:hypothetical protein
MEDNKDMGAGFWAAVMLLFGNFLYYALILIFFAIVAMSMYASLNGIGPGSGATGDAGIRDTTCTTPLYPNIIDEAAFAQAIDESIPSNSPLKGMGKYYVSGAKAAGVNPALIYAISYKESKFGTLGIAKKGTNNAFGRTATTHQPNISINNRTWYKWSSWEQSLSYSGTDYEDEPSYIKRRYVDQGKKTIKAMMYTYAPPSENNTDGYIAQIYSWINDIITKANKIKPGAVGCT